jgi:hypothetical protein
VDAAAADADTVFDEQLLAANKSGADTNNSSNTDCADSDTVGAEAAASATAALANLLSAEHAANAVRVVAAGGLELLTLMAGASTTTTSTNTTAAAAAVGRLRDAEAMVRCAAAAAEALANATRVCGTECAARVIALGTAGVVPLVLLCASRNALVSALMQLCTAVT